MAHLPPGPKGLPLIGMLNVYRRSSINFMLDMARTYGDIAYYRLGPYHVYQLNHPDLIQEVLVTQAHKFEKSKLDHQIFSQSMGSGLLVSEGDFHKRQRKLAQPAFHTRRIEAYAEVMVDYAQRMIDGWRDGEKRDIHQEMTRLTLFIVSKTLYDADVSAQADGIGEAIHDLNEVGGAQYSQGFAWPRWLPIPPMNRVRRGVGIVDSIMMPIIAQRRASGEDHGDLLSMLLMAQDEDTGGQMTDRQVRDEAVSLFIAGHETTSNALSWAWYLVAQHPEVEAKLHAEVDSVLAGNVPTMRDLGQLPYNEMVIKEAMRLYPPAWILNAREPQEDVQIGSTIIPKGSKVFLVPYVMHRDPRYFDDPERFWPERWADGLEKRIPRYAYFPFGGGPRVCIGSSFAMMEARLILATVAQRYSFSLAPGQRVEPDALITMRPRDGLPMVMHARQPVPVEKPAI